MLNEADLSYIQTNFVPLETLCTHRGIAVSEVRDLVASRRLPLPSYTLDDGAEMVPADYFALWDAAGEKDVETLFRTRFAAKAQELGLGSNDYDLAGEWNQYLSGEYGVCLREQTPENVCAKGFHMTAIQSLLDRPQRDDLTWRQALARHVDALDRLERPFAAYDRVRWGPVSRDRLITGPRESYPEAFLAITHEA